MSVPSQESRLSYLLRAFRHEILVAYESLAVVRVVLATEKCCPSSYADNAFVWSSFGMGLDHLFMALARLFDDDTQTTSIVAICNYGEQNPQQFVEATSKAPGDPSKQEAIRQACRDIRTKFESHPHRGAIKNIRDKVLAHRDKDVWLGKTSVPGIGLMDIETLIRELADAYNSLRIMVDGTHVHHVNVYEQVLNAGKHTFSRDEVLLQRMMDYDNIDDRLVVSLSSQLQTMQRFIDETLHQPPDEVE